MRRGPRTKGDADSTTYLHDDLRSAANEDADAHGEVRVLLA
jgi:hypothetical protein